MRYLGPSIYLGLGLGCDLASLDVIIVNNELKCPILIVLEIFEPVVKVVPEPFVWLNQVFGHPSAPLSGPTTIIRADIGRLLAVWPGTWWALLPL
jgi:hypothetical protein